MLQQGQPFQQGGLLRKLVQQYNMQQNAKQQPQMRGGTPLLNRLQNQMPRRSPLPAQRTGEDTGIIATALKKKYGEDSGGVLQTLINEIMKAATSR